MLGGVARLLAVADLTVKTNIRTARRGTLRAATTSSTMQADHRAWFVCKFPSGSRTYVSNAKLDKNTASTRSTPTLITPTHACVHRTRLLTNHRPFGRSLKPPPGGGGSSSHTLALDGVVLSSLLRARHCESPFLASLPARRCGGRARRPGAGRYRPARAASPAARCLVTASGSGGGAASSQAELARRRQRDRRTAGAASATDSPEVRFTASSRLPVTSFPRTASR